MPRALPARDPPRLARLWGAGWGQVPPRGVRAHPEECWRQGVADGAPVGWFWPRRTWAGLVM